MSTAEEMGYWDGMAFHDGHEKEGREIFKRGQSNQ